MPDSLTATRIEAVWPALGGAPSIPKAARVLAARLGFHEGVDLGGPAMARIAKDYGYTLAELREL